MSKSYASIQTFEAKRLSIDLLDNPEDFYMHNRRYSASVIMTVVYGRPIPKCTFPHSLCIPVQRGAYEEDERKRGGGGRVFFFVFKGLLFFWLFFFVWRKKEK